MNISCLEGLMGNVRHTALSLYSEVHSPANQTIFIFGNGVCGGGRGLEAVHFKLQFQVLVFTHVKTRIMAKLIVVR